MWIRVNNLEEMHRRRSTKIRCLTVEQKQLANLRERRRMLAIYEGFELLRRQLPLEKLCPRPQKVTRLQLLRLALHYIKTLEQILHMYN